MTKHERFPYSVNLAVEACRWVHIYTLAPEIKNVLFAILLITLSYGLSLFLKGKKKFLYQNKHPGIYNEALPPTLTQTTFPVAEIYYY